MDLINKSSEDPLETLEFYLSSILDSKIAHSSPFVPQKLFCSGWIMRMVLVHQN